ncbi:unnamed protein product (mitochondrion) [Plasmodiophora brassicae]|uniref:Zn(2)-C6 fungal-type domain-containing protein n=2 Tax=Plasmodiophora brassicae TaxID=37360 RepID=A0A3P3YAV7_PLABS|nr:unnamed protein product [Plasmodiophora brassicae]
MTASGGHHQTAGSVRTRVGACAQCHTAKVACSQRFPCDRCIRKGRAASCMPWGMGPGRPVKNGILSPMSLAVVVTDALKLAIVEGYGGLALDPIANFVADHRDDMFSTFNWLSYVLNCRERIMLHNQVLALARRAQPATFGQQSLFPADLPLITDGLHLQRSLQFVVPRQAQWVAVSPGTTNDTLIQILMHAAPGVLVRSIYLNEAATALFGYTADELNKHANDHSTRENDASPMFVPPFFKLFAPSTWPDILRLHIHLLFNRRVSATAKLPVRIITRTGRSIQFSSTWQMDWIDETKADLLTIFLHSQSQTF